MVEVSKEEYDYLVAEIKEKIEQKNLVFQNAVPGEFAAIQFSEDKFFINTKFVTLH